MDVISEPSACSRLPASLRGSLCWPLARVGQAIVAAHNDALSEYGLNLRTFAVLAMVAHGPTRSQLEIAKAVGLDKSTLVATLDSLEAVGLLERRPDPADRRARVVVATEKGRMLVDQAAEVVKETETRILSGVSCEDASRIKETLIALMEGPLRSESGSGSCL
jgi:DNA-binding MarR family transcriptional regulator